MDKLVKGKVYKLVRQTSDEFCKRNGYYYRYNGEGGPFGCNFTSLLSGLLSGFNCQPLWTCLELADKEFNDDLKDIIQDNKFIIEDLCGNGIIVTEEQYNEIQKEYDKYKKEIYEQNNNNT